MTVKGNRLLVSVIHDDTGGSEIYWARTDQDVTSVFDGSMLIQHDGSTLMRCATDSDIPFVLHVEGNRVRVALTEDMPPNYDQDKVVFDSAKDVPEWP